MDWQNINQRNSVAKKHNRTHKKTQKQNVMDVPSSLHNYTVMQLNYNFQKREPLTLKLLFSK